MKPINIYALTRIVDSDLYLKYEQKLSNIINELQENLPERESLKALVDVLENIGLEPKYYNGFYYSYNIPQISKEFDLLKISLDKSIIIDVELKSDDVGIEKIKKQLVRNKYYLEHITDKMFLFTFVNATGKLYSLYDDGSAGEISIDEFLRSLRQLDDFYEGDLDTLFDPVQFLVSPINNPEKFMENRYFLTSQQEEIRNEIIKCIESHLKINYAIRGDAGTGKTLLLYDIVKECSKNHRVCVIHCGILGDGHIELNEKMKNVNIIPIKSIKDDYDFSEYEMIFIDETQRINPKQFDYIKVTAEERNMPMICLFDPAQFLSRSEAEHQSEDVLMKWCNRNCYLRGKIRTNQEMTAFIKNIFDLGKRNHNYKYDCVDVLFAGNMEELEMLVGSFQAMDYVFINYTGSLYNHSCLDELNRFTNYNSHKVLGQEFDNVLVFMGEDFFYDGNYLRSKPSPNPDYLYFKMLFQAMTRVRKKLGIIVYENIDLFTKLINIKG